MTLRKTKALSGWAAKAVGAAFAIAACGSGFAANSPNDPHYRFVPQKNDGRVCEHMLKVFNSEFQRMWPHPKWLMKEAEVFAADSKYAFPLLPGAEHRPAWTRKMMYSKVPSSPEFDAVQWRQGQAMQTEVPGGPVILPYLIAHVDIDNDGALDTLVKVEFTNGYGALANRGPAANSELILMWRDQALDFPQGSTLEEIIRGGAKWSHPMGMYADYLRPFVFDGQSYMARYEQEWDSESADSAKLPHETMSILQLRFEGLKDAAGSDEWTTTALCVFNMKQTN